MSILENLNKQIHKKNITNISDSLIGSSKLFLESSTKDKTLQIEEAAVVHNTSLYPLFFVRNLKNRLCSFSYLGNKYFIGVLTNKQIYEIKTFNDLYKIYINKVINVSICEIYVAETNQDKSLQLVIIKTSDHEILNYKEPIELISPVDYLNFEQPGNIFLLKDDDDIGIELQVNKITNDSIFIDRPIDVSNGNPLFINNKLVGIFSKKANDYLIFYRISYYLEWITKHCCSFIKSINTSIPKNTIYTQEQLLSIIASLNQKVDNLEKRLEGKELIRFPFQELIEKNNLKNEETVGQLINTIGVLQKKLNDQDIKFNYMFETLNKMGF